MEIDEDNSEDESDDDIVLSTASRDTELDKREAEYKKIGLHVMEAENMRELANHYKSKAK